ncbi:MAG: hypothetical protein ACI9FJ_002926 [Alteromonadaceae bacterium]
MGVIIDSSPPALYYARLMQKLKIPITLDIKKAAQHQTSYSGYVLLTQMKRLTQSLSDNQGDVDVNVQTGKDHQGLLFLKGDAQVKANSVCQRCNESMTIDLTASFAYSPVKAGVLEDEENQLPDWYDTIEINEFGDIELIKLVEDELMLSLPIIPMHDEQDCSAADRQVTWGEIEEVEEEKPNPFAVLEQLKRK